MKRADFKKKLAEEIQAGLRGFIGNLLNKYDQRADGSIRITKYQVARWKKMVRSTHYKSPPGEKAWANNVADNVIDLMSKAKKTAAKTPADPRVNKIIKEFTNYCQNLRGFTPEINYGRDILMIKKTLERHDEEVILDAFDWFLRDKSIPLSPTISTILSAGVFNKFLSQR